jgi:hypothetical protein
MIPTYDGRVALATWLMSRPLAIAMGRGNPTWGQTPPDPVATATALLDPVVLCRPRIQSYVTPDANGPVRLADGTVWAISAPPTAHVYLSIRLDYTDIPTETLREMAVVFDPVINAAVPVGQFVVPWAQVTNAGKIYAIEHTPPLERQHTEHSFGVVLDL